MSYFKVEEEGVTRAATYFTKSDGTYAYIELPIENWSDSENYHQILHDTYIHLNGTYDNDGNFIAPEFTILSMTAEQPEAP